MLRLRALLQVCHVSFLVSAVLQPPNNLQLYSSNFQHILTWDDPNNTSLLYYHVEYSKNHHPFLSTRHCSNITTRRCDLTKDFTEVIGKYEVRVKSFTDHSISKASSPRVLKPIQNTLLGPAVVDVVACDHCIRVSIRPPVSHLWSEEEQQTMDMLSGDVYPILEYTIQLVHSTEVSTYPVEFNRENDTIIPDLLPKTNYCVSVNVSTSQNIMPSIPSALKCVITLNGASRAYIPVLIVFAIIFCIGTLFFLIGLDKAGYICMARNFFPKVLKPFPASEDIFGRSNEFSCPTYITHVEIVNKKDQVEESQEKDDKYCGEGYATRKRLLSNSGSGTTGTVSSGQLPSAVSTSVESSGQVSGSSTKEENCMEQPTGMDIIAAPEGSCSFNAPVPGNAPNNSSTHLFNSSGDFNINLNSVSIPEDSWTGFEHEAAPKAEPVVLMRPNVAGIITLDMENHRHFPSVINDDALQYASTEEEEEEGEGVSENNSSDEHFASGYMRR